MSILVDRLWRTVKYEGAYPHRHHTICETRQSLEEYFSVLQRGEATKGPGILHILRGIFWIYSQ